MIKDLQYYLSRFTEKLKIYKSSSRGQAPYKPILLLSVIELIAQGFIKKNQILLTPDLIATFIKYRNALGTDFYQANLAQPFFHLTSDKFWYLKAQPGYEKVIEHRIKLKNLFELRNAVQYAYLDDELFDLLQNQNVRNILLATILNFWFPSKTTQIESLLRINSFEEFQNRLREKGGEIYKPEDIKNEDEEQKDVRDAAFREIVTSAYNYCCAFCELQVINSLGRNIVDGAHIKPFAKFYDDRINNGISLCKNHHWAFDHYWFTINDDYTILVSNDLKEKSPHGKLIKEFQGKHILLPIEDRYRPRDDSLYWHREQFFELQ